MIVRGDGPIPARIMLVGEWPGPDEARTGVPFSGYSGQELNRMLHEAGLIRSECYVTNVVREVLSDEQKLTAVSLRKKDTTPAHLPLRDKMVMPFVLAGYQELLGEIAAVKPNVIVPLGNLPMWALTGVWGITKWRGSQLRVDWDSSGPKVIPTYNPAAIMRQWDWRAIAVRDFRRVAAHIGDRVYRDLGWRFTLRPSFTQVISVLSELYDKLQHDVRWIDFDLETRAGHIACAGLSWSQTEAISIPFMCVENKDGYWSEEEEGTIVWWLWRVLCHRNARVRWQNGLYDSQYTYRHWHFVPRGAQDTMISHHTAFAGLPKSLAFQASMYCQDYVFWKDDGKEWDKKLGEDSLWSYNCVDCVRTREVGEVSNNVVISYGLQEVDDFQQSLFWAVLETMTRGVRIDQKAQGAFALELQEEMSKREAFFLEVLGHPLNPSSSPQMIKLFYEDLGQPTIMSRPKKGQPPHPTCDDEALKLIREREPLLRDLVRSIREWRSLAVFLRTFVRARLDQDGRMRCSYNICGTETYRFASSESAFDTGTNLSNIPKGGEDDEDSDLVLPNVRKLFIPDPGFEFFDTDLSKADLRIVVWESDETEMKAILREGRDPYIETAREFYKDPSIEKLLPSGQENPKYGRFKSFSHGTHYLGTPKGLARRLGLLVHEAERTQRWYFGKYPRILAWHTRLKAEINRTHMVTNRFGYRRFYFDRIDDSVYRQAVAWIPQSTVAILINKIYMNIFKNLREVQVLLQVHDSLAGQYPSHLKDWAKRRIKEEAVVVIPYEDPLVIPVGIKTSPLSWGDCA